MTKYTDLITAEHALRTKFVATIGASTQAALDQQALAVSLTAAFDLDTAVGVQLDAVGAWAGIKRSVLIPLTGVYFAWDTMGVGWNQGYWKGQFDPSQGLSNLGDTSYRLLIRATIALNHWDGTIGGAIAAITPLFPLNYVYIQDNQDMSITVAVSGPPVDLVSAALLTGGYLALKPVGVRLNVYFPSAATGAVFGFDADNAYVGGWGHGSWGISAPFTG